MKQEERLEAIEALMANERTMVLFSILGILLVGVGIGFSYLLIKYPATPIDYTVPFLIFAGAIVAFYGFVSYLRRRQQILKKYDHRLERIPF
jgi:uncharacterized membrane protein YczE